MRFRLNRDFERELQAEADTRGALVRAATTVARRAEAARHSIMPRQRSGAIEVEVDGNDVRLANTDHGGHLDEFGSAKNPPYAPLRRSVRGAGIRLDEHGK